MLARINRDIQRSSQIPRHECYSLYGSITLCQANQNRRQHLNLSRFNNNCVRETFHDFIEFFMHETWAEYLSKLFSPIKIKCKLCLSLDLSTRDLPWRKKSRLKVRTNSLWNLIVVSFKFRHSVLSSASIQQSDAMRHDNKNTDKRKKWNENKTTLYTFVQNASFHYQLSF